MYKMSKNLIVPSDLPRLDGGRKDNRDTVCGCMPCAQARCMLTVSRQKPYMHQKI